MVSKKIVVAFVFSVLVTGYMVNGFIRLSVENRQKQDEIKTLNQRLEKIRQRLDDQEEQMGKVNILSYRDKVIRKKYPLFSKIVDVVFRKSKEYGFNPNLILSLIQIESNFRPRVVSSKGAYGLMQVNYSVWKEELDIDNLRIFDIEYNIDLGMQILKRYYDEAGGDLLQTLHLYNNGYLNNNHKYKHKVVSSVFY